MLMRASAVATVPAFSNRPSPWVPTAKHDQSLVQPQVIKRATGWGVGEIVRRKAVHDGTGLGDLLDPKGHLPDDRPATRSVGQWSGFDSKRFGYMIESMFIKPTYVVNDYARA
jgi:hypothetical protein